MTDENGIAWYPTLAGMGDIDEATGAADDVQLNTVYTDVLPRVGEYVALRIYESPHGVMDSVEAVLRVTRIEHRAWRTNVGGIWVTLDTADDENERRRVMDGLRRLEEETQP